MPSTIGVRVYRFDFRERGSRSLLAFDSPSLARHPRDFIDDFATKNSTHNQSSETERSWYFEKKQSNDKNNLRGYVHYGTFGFESKLVDSQTKAKKYQRKVTDVEEIPLLFDFWAPSNSRFGLVAFQSFQGRSCINLVMKKMKDDLEKESPGCSLIFKKLMPSDLKGSIFYTAPIKRMRLIRRKVDVDPADLYLNEGSGDSIDMELTLSARRRKHLGNLISLKTKMPSDRSGLIEYEGLEFDEAVAEIKIGKTLRRVGVFGYNSDAGVIDLTDNIDKGMDGHPTFESLQRETTSLLTDFYRAVNGGRL